MTTLLIMTVGKSDVQLVHGGQRFMLAPRSCGKLHDEIVRRQFRIENSPTDYSRKHLTELPEGDLTLCTPKLDAVLRFVPTSCEPLVTLIVDTRREKRDDDPRGAGLILGRRLEALGYLPPQYHSMLEGAELLEDRANPKDAVIRRSVVQGLANSIAAQVTEACPAEVFVATTGGFPEANRVVEELARLHAVGIGSKVEIIEVPDGSQDSQQDEAVPERFHPATELRARWQALSLIETGNWLGAWGAVSHLSSEPELIWTRVVDWLRCFASSLPLPDDCDIAVLTHQQMAVRTSLRVELALRANDIPSAIRGTVAFFEAALWDGLYERMERSTDPKRRKFFRFKDGKSLEGKNLLRDGQDWKSDRSRPFELKDEYSGCKWFWIYDGNGGPATRLARDFLERQDLVELDKALNLEVRDLRNDVSHNEPTPGLMQGACKIMQEAKLWSEDGGFLKQEIVRNVLQKSGVDDPEQLLDSVLTEVRARLVTI